MTTALASRVSKLEQSVGVVVPVDLGTLWTPQSEPQRLALESEANEVYYGGAAGGGKTDLLIGAALTQHRRSVIFRREYAQHSAIIDRVTEVVEPIDEHVAYNGTDRRWRLPGNRSLELGAAQHEDSVRKWRGRPHDGKFFDELPEFTEAQYLFFGGWARTTVPGQRVRRIGAGNPPTDADGEWVIQRWAPWLDEQHPNPALPGELRWFVRIDGKDTEVEGPDPIEWQGETLYPQSRTFIPAKLADNEFLSRDAAYRATLQSMPEPLRSQLLYGDHSIGLQDDEWQVIPSAWVRAAQARWTPKRPTMDDEWGRPVPAPLDQIGADVAQGGADNTVLARRYGDWFAEPEVHPGTSVPDAAANAGHIDRAMVEGGVVAVDTDGIGASTYFLLAAGVYADRMISYRGSAKIPMLRDRSGRLTFVNQRAAAWWAMRDALDPAHGSTVALPPSRELRADLSSARWSKQTDGIKIEDKKEIKARIGRSPDLGDAYVMANARWLAPAQPLQTRDVTIGTGFGQPGPRADFQRLQLPAPARVRR